jgi:hypothetical protein
LDNYRLLELIFGTLTSVGVLYALLSPTFRRHYRKKQIKQIIQDEMSENYMTVEFGFFKDGFENVDESKITVGDLFVCSINLRDSSWEMLKDEASELFSPRVFVTIDAYYYQVESIIEIATRLKSQGIVDDEKELKLKDIIPSIEFEYVLWVAIDVIIGFDDKYRKMLKLDKEVDK